MGPVDLDEVEDEVAAEVREDFPHASKSVLARPHIGDQVERDGSGPPRSQSQVPGA